MREAIVFSLVPIEVDNELISELAGAVPGEDVPIFELRQLAITAGSTPREETNEVTRGRAPQKRSSPPVRTS